VFQIFLFFSILGIICKKSTLKIMMLKFEQLKRFSSLISGIPRELLSFPSISIMIEVFEIKINIQRAIKIN
jgi:hypothetical protein